LCHMDLNAYVKVLPTASPTYLEALALYNARIKVTFKKAI